MIDALAAVRVPPALFLIAGGLLLPLLPRPIRTLLLLVLPLLTLAQLLTTPFGAYGTVAAFGHELVFFRLDSLSFTFALAFHVAMILSAIYALHVRDPIEQAASLIYPGATIGAVLAGDLLSAFIFIEIMAVGSALLIWVARTEDAYRAAIRYLAIHVLAGSLFLVGVIIHENASGSLAFDVMRAGKTPGDAFILIALGLKAAFPLLHNWVQDTYPKSTVSGTLVLSFFTTKFAVYALARSFPGTEALITVGVVMTAFPVFFAVIENDLRRVLCYSLNNQVGFMVAAIGVGTPLALNGAAGYALTNIVFEGLLFMAVGAVLFRTGTAKGTDLGGLWRSMPLTTLLCIIGALSISGMPLFSGFVAKGMILTAVAEEGHRVAFLMLLGASAGVLHHAGIKIPYFAFFAHDSGKRVAEAPAHMLAAMIVAAAICIAIGVFPGLLYAVLPYPVDYTAYTYDHIVTQAQLVLFAVFAFAVLMRAGLYPPEQRAVHLDTDWLYRRLIPQLVSAIVSDLAAASQRANTLFARQAERFVAALYRHHGPSGILARSWPTGSMVLWVTIMLAGTLLAIYLFA